MPANLTPQYNKAEEKYRQAQTAQEQIDCLDEMLRVIPKHKGTEKLQADLKTKLKEARAEQAAERSAPKKTKGYRFPRQGAGQILLVGGPNAGKSRILAELTNAKPEVAPYPFTTREPMPGMMKWEDAVVQLIDTPAITADSFEVYLINLARTADAIVLVMDGSSDDSPEATSAVIEQFANRKTILSTRSGFDDEQFAIVHVKTLLVVTHGADAELAGRLEFLREMRSIPFETLTVELDQPADVAKLRDSLYQMLNVIRVYTKAPGKPADYSAPFTLPAGGTIEDLAAKVSRDLASQVKFAKIWGTAVHDGQSVGVDHLLHDKDLVELHT